MSKIPKNAKRNKPRKCQKCKIFAIVHGPNACAKIAIAFANFVKVQKNTKTSKITNFKNSENLKVFKKVLRNRENLKNRENLRNRENLEICEKSLSKIEIANFSKIVKNFKNRENLKISKSYENLKNLKK